MANQQNPELARYRQFIINQKSKVHSTQGTANGILGDAIMMAFSETLEQIENLVNQKQELVTQVSQQAKKIAELEKKVPKEVKEIEKIPNIETPEKTD